MEVLFVDNFAIKSLKNSENSVFFIEGFKNNIILRYNHKSKEFVLMPVSYQGKTKDIKEIINEIKSNVSLINRLKIQMSNTATIWQFQLGKAKFQITNFEESENLFYYEQAKHALLHVNDRHPDNIKAHIRGYAEFDEDIWTLAKNLSKIDVEKLKNKPKQLEIPATSYTETI